MDHLPELDRREAESPVDRAGERRHPRGVPMDVVLVLAQRPEDEIAGPPAYGPLQAAGAKGPMPRCRPPRRRGRDHAGGGIARPGDPQRAG